MFSLLTLSLFLGLLRRECYSEWWNLLRLVLLGTVDLILREGSLEMRQRKERVVEVEGPNLVWQPLKSETFCVYACVPVSLVRPVSNLL